MPTLPLLLCILISVVCNCWEIESEGPNGATTADPDTFKSGNIEYDDGFFKWSSFNTKAWQSSLKRERIKIEKTNRYGKEERIKSEIMNERIRRERE